MRFPAGSVTQSRELIERVVMAGDPLAHVLAEFRTRREPQPAAPISPVSRAFSVTIDDLVSYDAHARVLTAHAHAGRDHLEVMERFGRFPNRNPLLGRESSADEHEWLASGRKERQVPTPDAEEEAQKRGKRGQPAA